MTRTLKEKIGDVIYTLNYVKSGAASDPVASIRACIEVLGEAMSGYVVAAADKRNQP